jgi:hypothetical protein
MRFEFAGLSYTVDFFRGVQERPDYAKASPVQTTAKIYKFVDGQKVVVREATVRHYHKDSFSLESGRKAALTKAMYDAPTMNGGAPLLGEPLSKDFRTAVWCAYHGRSVEAARKAGLTD